MYLFQTQVYLTMFFFDIMTVNKIYKAICMITFNLKLEGPYIMAINKFTKQCA